jgi:4-hydroxybenzoate polyprenyltransferase
MFRTLRLTLRMIRFEHTVFALPFAVLSLLVASDGRPRPGTVGWILLAMVGARSTAMAFNRLADQRLDALNPRTAGRELPAGRLRRGPVIAFTVGMALLFVLAAARLNRLCLMLSPAALVVICGYSFTKRFTPASHAVLGLGLAIAPVGAWLAVRGRFDAFPLLLGGAVLCWVAGFDIIYACQDTAFDRSHGLHSLSARVGDRGALWVARVAHVVAVGLLGVAIRGVGMGALAWSGLAVVAGLLAYEHWLVRGGDLTHIDRAFFTVNSYVGLALLLFAAADLYLG